MEPRKDIKPGTTVTAEAFVKMQKDLANMQEQNARMMQMMQAMTTQLNALQAEVDQLKEAPLVEATQVSNTSTDHIPMAETLEIGTSPVDAPSIETLKAAKRYIKLSDLTEEITQYRNYITDNHTYPPEGTITIRDYLKLVSSRESTFALFVPNKKEGNKDPDSYYWKSEAYLDTATCILKACGENIALKKALLAIELNEHMFAVPVLLNSKDAYGVYILEFFDTIKNIAEKTTYIKILEIIEHDKSLFLDMLPKYIEAGFTTEFVQHVCNYCVEATFFKECTDKMPDNFQLEKAALFEHAIERTSLSMNKHLGGVNYSWVKKNLAWMIDNSKQLACRQETHSIIGSHIIKLAFIAPKTHQKIAIENLTSNKDGGMLRGFNALMQFEPRNLEDLKFEQWSSDLAYLKDLCLFLQVERSKRTQSFLDAVSQYISREGYAALDEEGKQNVDQQVVINALTLLLEQKSSKMAAKVGSVISSAKSAMFNSEQNIEISTTKKTIQEFINRLSPTDKNAPPGVKNITSEISELLTSLETHYYQQKESNSSSSKDDIAETRRALAYLYYLMSTITKKHDITRPTNAPFINVMAEVVDPNAVVAEPLFEEQKNSSFDHPLPSAPPPPANTLSHEDVAWLRETTTDGELINELKKFHPVIVADQTGLAPGTSISIDRYLSQLSKTDLYLRTNETDSASPKFRWLDSINLATIVAALEACGDNIALKKAFIVNVRLPKLETGNISAKTISALFNIIKQVDDKNASMEVLKRVFPSYAPEQLSIYVKQGNIDELAERLKMPTENIEERNDNRSSNLSPR